MPQQQVQKRHFQQIDVLKGLAIIAVILLHSLSKTQLHKSFAVFHIWQAVPVFMVLMGLNLGLSLKPASFKSFYSKAYFSKKATRILIPFIIVFVTSIVFGLLWKLWLDKDVLKFSWYTFIGMLPVTGKGNYFITLILQSILILPVLGYGFIKRPVLTTIALVLIEVIFLLASKQFQLFDKETYLYSAALPRYFTALAYGVWLSKVVKQPFTWRPLSPFLIMGALGGVYLFYKTQGKLKVDQVYDSWEAQNVISFGYAALLVFMTIVILPAISSNPILKFFAALGKASYHVFLVQVVYFGLVSDFGNLLQNLTICLATGYSFYLLETRFSKKLSS